jgi:hypothetical protein
MESTRAPSIPTATFASALPKQHPQNPRHTAAVIVIKKLLYGHQRQALPLRRLEKIAHVVRVALHDDLALSGLKLSFGAEVLLEGMQLAQVEMAAGLERLGGLRKDRIELLDMLQH